MNDPEADQPEPAPPEDGPTPPEETAGEQPANGQAPAEPAAVEQPQADPAPADTPAPPDDPARLLAQAARSARRRHQHDHGGVLRVVIVLWCFWLLGAWAAAWVSDTSIPRVRWMLFAGSFGLMLVWPAFRLSERIKPGRVGDAVGPVLLDWLALVGVYQAVIWSLHLIAVWPLVRGLWLDAVIIAWSLVTALIVAVARLWPGAAARSLGMLCCIALVFAEPVAVWAWVVSGSEGWSMRVSPIQALWELTASPGTDVVSPWDVRAMQVLLVGLAGWGALGLWAVGERVGRRRASRSAAGA